MATPSPDDNLTRDEFREYLLNSTAPNLWRARQEVYLNDRRQRLDDLNKFEFMQDARLLRKAWIELPRTNVQYPFATDLNYDFFNSRGPRVASKPMSGKGVYPLEDLTKFLHGTIDALALERWRAQFDDVMFERKRRAVEWEHDQFKPAPSSGIAALQQAFPFLERAEQPETDGLSPIRTLYHLYTLMTHLRPLRRFADLRNPEVAVEPAADGSNLHVSPAMFPPTPPGSNLPPNLRFAPVGNDPMPNAKLVASWVLHRAWIRTLHYRSMKMGNEEIGLEHLRQILWLNFVMYQDEVNYVAPHLPKDMQNNGGNFRPVWDLLHTIEEILEDLGQDMKVETRNQDMTRYTEDATIAYNAKPEELGQLVQKHIIDGKLVNFSFWRLFSTILDRAELFNRVTDEEHVEDELMNKRIVVQDEEFVAMELILERGEVKNVFDPPRVPDFLPYQRLLTKNSQFHRMRRNYLLLRDWNQKRPWKQLYLVIDTDSIAYPEQIEDIKNFHESLEYLRTINPMPLLKHIPSNAANIYASLFPLHPIASTEPPAHLQDKWDSGCVICMSQFSATKSSTITELQCSHLFHYSCIRRSWDTENALTFKCPFCRENHNSHSLPSIGGIQPEALEVWDFAEVTTPEIARTNNELTNGYWDTHQSILDLSTNWATQQVDDEGMMILPRVARVEKAWLREWRRNANRTKRARIEQEMKGTAFLDADEDGLDVLRESAVAGVMGVALVNVPPTPLLASSPALSSSGGNGGIALVPSSVSPSVRAAMGARGRLPMQRTPIGKNKGSQRSRRS